MITFKSRAAASVMMFDEVARQLLEIMGKTPDDQGIITLKQLPQALARLEAAASGDRARGRAAEEGEEEEEVASGPRAISLSQRAVPLIELLSRSVESKEPVIWER